MRGSGDVRLLRVGQISRPWGLGACLLVSVVSLGCGHIGVDLDADAAVDPAQDEVSKDEAATQDEKQDDKETDKPYEDDELDDEALADESASDTSLLLDASVHVRDASVEAGVVGVDFDDGGASDDEADDTDAEMTSHAADGSSRPAQDAAPDRDTSSRMDSGLHLDANLLDGALLGPALCDPSCTCAEEETCTQSCAAEQCAVSCGERTDCRLAVGSAERVEVECGALATCQASESSSQNVQFVCSGEGDCHAKCGQAETCSLQCVGAGSCTLLCGGALDCSLDCSEDASCMLVREEPLTELELDCKTDARLECGDSILACNVTCPD